MNDGAWSGLIYATLLPNETIKVGRGRNESRALAAGTYFVEPVELLALWESGHPVRDESLAFYGAREFHIVRELFKGHDPFGLVLAISRKMGPPFDVGDRINYSALRAKLKVPPNAEAANVDRSSVGRLGIVEAGREQDWAGLS
jgi:hypothetical protein